MPVNVHGLARTNGEPETNKIATAREGKNQGVSGECFTDGFKILFFIGLMTFKRLGKRKRGDHRLSLVIFQRQEGYCFTLQTRYGDSVWPSA